MNSAQKKTAPLPSLHLRVKQSPSKNSAVRSKAFKFILQESDMKETIVHHVFFWLKNPGSKQDQEALLEGLKTLSGIETVRAIYIGLPASTEERSVVDSSYSASEILFFDDLKGQKEYQDHPIHQEFIKRCGHLWEKVVVYDTVNVYSGG
jgi:hypothetical protein